MPGEIASAGFVSLALHSVEWIQSVSVIEILVFDIARDCSEEVNFVSLEGERTKVRVRVRVR
jgi:hypothetical protein